MTRINQAAPNSIAEIEMNCLCKLCFPVLIIFLGFIRSLNVSAQNSHWAKSFGKSGDDRGNKIAADSKGFVYMVGVFSGSNVAFGSVTLTSSGGKDIFICKYDCGGNIVWAVRMGGSGDELDECTMEVDQFDNLYVSGGFKSTATFGTVSGSTISKTSSGDADVFIAKYSETGVLKWVKTGNGTGIDNSNDMCTDNQGNIYVTGHYGHNNKSITFGSFTLSSSGSFDIFIVKIDSSGNYKWARSEGGNGDDWGAGVGCDIFGNVYMTGEYGYSGTTANIGGKSLSLGGLWDMFIVKYRQADGTPVWVRTGNSNGNEAMTLVKCDSFGNVFGVGNHQSGTVFQSGSSGTFTPSYANTWNLVVIKYDSNGVIQWHRGGGTKNQCQIHDMSMNHEQDSLIFCGYIQDSLTFGTKKTTITASSSFFYAVFDSAGNFGRAKAYGSTAGKYNYACGVCYDPSSNIYVSGFYQGTVNFGGNSNTSNAGTIDGFLVKYCTAGNLAIDTALSVNITHPYCLDSTDYLSVRFIFGDIYQWFKDGDSIQGATKNYYRPNSGGTYHLIIHRNCCSIDSTRKYTLPTQIILSVSLGPDTTVCGSSLTLDAGNTGASYLWNNSSTAKTLNVTSSGTYWVKVTKNGCMAYDTISANLGGLTISLGNDTTLCKGNTLNLNAGNTGGSYSWNTGDTSQTITANKAGKYVLSVTANNCSSKDSIIVSYDSVVVNLGSDTTVCGASAYTLKSGIAGASYLWSNSSTGQNLSATSDGTYWVKVTKNGCIGYDTATVLLSNLTAPLGNDTTLCKGYTISLNAGNIGSTYVWNTGDTSKTITVSLAGKYKVTLSEKGCSKQDSINVAYDSVILDLGPDRNLCGVSKDTLNAGNTGAVFLWKDNSNKQTLIVNSSGTYWVKVTKNGCSAYDTIDVSLNAIGVNLGNDTTLCKGQNLTLKATDSCTYLWSDGSTGQTLNVAAAGKYWVEVGKNGCNGTDTINIAFDSIGVWLGNDTTICGNQTYILNCGVTGGSYLWSNGGTGQTLSSSSNGTYWVKVTRNNCLAADTIDLVFNTIKASLGNDTTICKGFTVDLDAKNPGNNYTWSTGSNSQKITVAHAGTYSVKVSDSICQSSDSILISFDSVIVDLGIDTTICNAKTYMLDAQNNGSAFLWSNGSNGQTLTVSTSGSYWAKVTKNNCLSSDTVSVQFNTNTVSLGNDTTICKGFSINLDAKNTGSTYAWNNGATSQQITASLAGIYTVAVNDGMCMHYDTLQLSIDSVLVNLGNDTLICGLGGHKLDAQNAGASYLWSTGGTNQTVNVSGNGIYWAKVTDKGCFAYDSIQITFDRPVVKLGNDSLLCPGESLVLDAKNIGSTYLWNDGSTAQTFIVTQAGTYWVQLQNANGCTAADTIHISYDTLSVNLGADTVLCQGTWVLDAGNTGFVHYFWNDGTNEQFDTAKATGLYSVMVNNGTCKAVDSIYLTFAGVFVLLPPDTVTCEDSILLISKSTPGLPLVWSTGDTTSYLWVKQSGTYTLTTTNGLCTGSDTKNVNFKIPPVANAGPDDTICLGETVAFSALPDGMLRYNWSSKDTAETISKEPLTNTTYLVRVYDGYCWSEYDSVEVIVLPKPTASFTTDKTGGVVPELIVATNTSQNIVSFLWEFGDGSSNSTDNVVSYNYTEPGKFMLSLMVTNAEGCTDTAIQLIHIKDTFTVFIPNSFTPNGDGLNDFFSINTSGSGEIEGFIVDRWGEIIFRFHYPDRLQWDGTFKGVVVQDELYGYCIWVTDQDNVQHMYKGHIVKLSKKK